MLGTPDFGHSDVWHFNFALKFLLSQALKAGYFPFWSKNIGTGFPLLGEGQTGMFYLPNIILFRIFSPELAFDLGFIFSLLLIFSGIYLFGRTLGISRLGAAFSAFIFSFSGIFITQMTHYNLIECLSLLPWVFFLVNRYLLSGKKISLVVLSLVLGQQIFTGFQQYVLITLIGAGFWVLFNRKSISQLFWLSLSVAAGVILALPQLLPSLELVRNSFRQSGTDLFELTKYPFSPANFAGFIYPYFFGDPRLGSYPRYSQTWGIFWETCGYIGIVPLVLSLLFFLKRTTGKLKPVKKTLLVIMSVSTVLMLGKFTPFFFLFQLSPLNMFRVPARFIILLVFSLSISAALFLDSVKSSRLKLFLVVISMLDLGFFATGYHAYIDPAVWLKKPESVEILSTDKSWYRIFSLIPSDDWNRILLSRGWRNTDDYLPFRNSLDPNQNLYWGINSSDYYAGLAPRRLELVRTLVYSGLTVNTKNRTLQISSESAKLLRLSGVKYFITPYNFTSDIPERPVATTSGKPAFFVYRLPNPFPHAYLSGGYLIADSILDLKNKVTDPENNLPVIEENPGFSSNPKSPLGQVKVTIDEDLRVEIEAETKKEALLVLSDSYYPDWQATVDSRPVKILPVNINERGVVIKPGKHTVLFSYKLKIL